MTILTILLYFIAFVTIIVLWVVYKVYTARIPLKHIKGPSPSLFEFLFGTWRSPSLEDAQYILNLHQKYGSMFKLSIGIWPVVLLNDPSVIEVLFVILLLFYSFIRAIINLFIH